MHHFWFDSTCVSGKNSPAKPYPSFRAPPQMSCISLRDPLDKPRGPLKHVCLVIQLCVEQGVINGGNQCRLKQKQNPTERLLISNLNYGQQRTSCAGAVSYEYYTNTTTSCSVWTSTGANTSAALTGLTPSLTTGRCGRSMPMERRMQTAETYGLLDPCHDNEI
jgi:hypothetical protein